MPASQVEQRLTIQAPKWETKFDVDNHWRREQNCHEEPHKIHRGVCWRCQKNPSASWIRKHRNRKIANKILNLSTIEDE